MTKLTLPWTRQGRFLRALAKTGNVAEACRAAGMRVAADDVGAGNSGLRLLSQVKFDIVKIDLSLVQGGISQDPSHAVLRALQELAAQWKASIVAEGVETAEQMTTLLNLGCDEAQGYLFSRPVPASEAGRLIARGFA